MHRTSPHDSPHQPSPMMAPMTDQQPHSPTAPHLTELTLTFNLISINYDNYDYVL